MAGKDGPYHFLSPSWGIIPEQGGEPTVGNLNLLLRPHPLNSELKAAPKGVIVDLWMCCCEHSDGLPSFRNFLEGNGIMGLCGMDNVQCDDLITRAVDWHTQAKRKQVRPKYGFS